MIKLVIKIICFIKQKYNKKMNIYNKAKIQ